MSSTSKPGNAVKFVGHDAIGLPMKRKQVHQACLSCRKRKKRCRHVPDSTPPPATGDAADHDTSEGKTRSTRAVPRPSSDPDTDTSDAAAQLLRFFHHASDKAPVGSPAADQRRQSQPAASPPPFLGDLNPEGILVEATMAQTAPAKAPQADGNSALQIGFLPPASPRQPRAPAAPDRGAVATGSPRVVEDSAGPFFSLPREDGSRLTIHVQDTVKLAELTQTLVNRALADKVLPSDQEWAAMRDLYLAKIHPIFPIFDDSTLVNLPERQSLRELIQAVVCLAAASDPEAGSCLTFKTSADGTRKSTAVSYDEYSHAMADFIKRRLAELQEAQQILLIYQIQVMALTCLYWQPASRPGRFEPLSLYAKLVSLVHTHGIHLGILASSPRDGDGDGSARRLFKCLYAIDRLIAATAARPLMFHNVDLMQVPRPESGDRPIFRLFLSLILLLDQVFEMYRPRPAISYIDIPVYERMAIEAGAHCEPESLLATLEVLYHAIGVLSVRMPRHRFRTAPECDTLHGPPTQHLPPSSLNARRSHSADRIHDVIKDYKLSPVPFVPYASTLSLSVAYRKWRFSQLPMFRARGGADFKRMLPMVQQLGAIWGSARVNGQLGQAVMLKLDQAEISRKRAKKDNANSASKRSRATASSSVHAPPGPSVMGEGDNVAQPGGTSTPTQTDRGEVPRSARQFVDSAQPGGAPNPPPTSQHPFTASAAPASAERPQTQAVPLTWTAVWTADGSGDTTDSHPKPPRSGPTLIRDTGLAHRPDIAAASILPGPEYSQLDNAIPLPGDLAPAPPIPTATGAQLAGPNDTSPLAGASSDGNLDEFLVGDDALFREWDPRFAQTVDFSFSSILDPGNPFAWPEYRDSMDEGWDWRALG